MVLDGNITALKCWEINYWNIANVHTAMKYNNWIILILFVWKCLYNPSNLGQCRQMGGDVQEVDS